MLSRRDKLFKHPWELQKFEHHRKKIENACCVVDAKTPILYAHVANNRKKLQAEKYRLDKINKENIRLLQRLGNIMNSKRMENFWQYPRPNFLNREKTALGRPLTCKARIESTAEVVETNVEQNRPSTAAIFMTEKKSQLYPLKTSITSIRCPTCSGKPIKTNQVVPEERIPWKTPKKSWNVKIFTKEYDVHKCCLKCCKF